MILKKLLSIFIILSLCKGIFGQQPDDLVIFDGLKNLYFCNSFPIYEDKNKLPFEEISSFKIEQQFTTYDSSKVLKKDSTYWIRLQLKNNFDYANSPERFYIQGPGHLFHPCVIHLRNNKDDSYQEDVIRRAKKVENGEKNRLIPFWIGSEICDMLFNDNEILIYYIQISPKQDIEIGEFCISFYSESSQKSIRTSSLLVLYFIGFLSMMFLYSLGLLFFLKEKSLGYYALYCFSQIIFNATSFNILDELIINYFPQYYKYELISYLFAHVAAFSFIFFVRHFLELKKMYPQWDKWLYYLGISFLVLLALELFILPRSNGHLDQHQRLMSLIIPTCITFTIFLVPLFRIANVKKYFIFFGILSMLVGLLYISLYFNFYLEGENRYLSKIDYAKFLPFCALELLLFALGFSYRIKENEEEKTQAQNLQRIIQNEQQLIKLEQKNLEELNELKAELYTNVTHEFRTPLTVILGMAEQITASKYTRESQLIIRNSNRLLKLVNQLLDLSKIDSKKIDIHWQQVDIISYIKYLIEPFFPLANQKNIKFKSVFSDITQQMDTDLEKLQQIIINLLSNALKFTSNGGTITIIISVIKNGSELEIKVSDTGLGISSRNLPYVFERFYQVKNKNLGSGSGIGLALCKELAKMLHGTISVESILGKGTTFIVNLPISQSSNKNADLQSIENYWIEEFEDEQPEALAILHPENSEKILLVEDNSEVLEYLILCLQNTYKVFTASNGIEGMKLAEKEMPHLIISDVMMPELDGYEFCFRLKNNIKTSHIPIILLTARGDQKSRLYGIDQGADAYLVKPFDRKELLLRVKKLLTLRDQMQVYYQQRYLQTIVRFPKEDTLISQLISLIESDFQNDWNADDLSARFHLSSSQLRRKVKDLCGFSLNIFIRRIRLKRAYQLLSNTNLPVKEIAYETGFHSPAHFSRYFKELFDKRPSDFRL